MAFKNVKAKVGSVKSKLPSFKTLPHDLREKIDAGAFGAVMGGLYSLATVPLAAFYTGIITEDLGMNNAGLPELAAIGALAVTIIGSAVREVKKVNKPSSTLMFDYDEALNGFKQALGLAAGAFGVMGALGAEMAMGADLNHNFIPFYVGALAQTAVVGGISLIEKMGSKKSGIL